MTDQVLSAGEGLEGAAFVQARTAATQAIEDAACGFGSAEADVSAGFVEELAVGGEQWCWALGGASTGGARVRCGSLRQGSGLARHDAFPASA